MWHYSSSNYLCSASQSLLSPACLKHIKLKQETDSICEEFREATHINKCPTTNTGKSSPRKTGYQERCGEEKISLGIINWKYGPNLRCKSRAQSSTCKVWYICRLWSILMSRKSSKGSRKPAWISKEILTELIQKKEAYKWWKWGQVTQEEYRVAVWSCKDRVRKAKADLELSLARDVKGKENPEQERPWVEEDQVREHINELGIYKSMEPDGLHPWMLWFQFKAAAK